MEDRDKLDTIYRNIVNKRDAVISLLDSIVNENLLILYNLHEEGWSPRDLFQED